MEVGQYVICIGETNINSTNGKNSSGWRRNLIFKISRISISEDWVEILWGGCEGSGVYSFPDIVRLATPEEINNFLPEGHADRVKISYEIY